PATFPYGRGRSRSAWEVCRAMADVGDRVEVLSKSGTRQGKVTRVSGAWVTGEWDTGGQTTVIPAPGVMTVMGATAKQAAPAERPRVPRIVEPIAYVFGPTPHHGITRDVPTRFHYDGRYDRLEPVSDVAVTASPGTPTQTQVSTQSGHTHIRIGDRNRTITGL